ncbi:DUF7940 domain-containing protein [Rhizobium leguminosarum]
MLVHNWREVLKRAWSVRLMITAALFSGLEVSLPLLDGYVDIPPRLFAVLSGLTVSAAFIARLMAQKGVSDANQ